MTNWRAVETQEERGRVGFLKLAELGVVENGLLFIAAVIIMRMLLFLLLF